MRYHDYEITFEREMGLYGAIVAQWGIDSPHAKTCREMIQRLGPIHLAPSRWIKYDIVKEGCAQPPSPPPAPLATNRMPAPPSRKVALKS